jgi:hypothetical protein
VPHCIRVVPYIVLDRLNISEYAPHPPKALAGMQANACRSCCGAARRAAARWRKAGRTSSTSANPQRASRFRLPAPVTPKAETFHSMRCLGPRALKQR